MQRQQTRSDAKDGWLGVALGVLDGVVPASEDGPAGCATALGRLASSAVDDEPWAGFVLPPALCTNRALPFLCVSRTSRQNRIRSQCAAASEKERREEVEVLALQRRVWA